MKRMGSQGIGNSNFGAAQTQPQGLKFNPVAGRGYLYSLTLDEVQNQLRDIEKPLSSVNIDELLTSLWTAEANNQVIGVAYEPTFDQPAMKSSLNPQSRLRLSRELNKSVDELWLDIQQGQSSLDEKATLGEMTLEDFLIKVGVVAESSSRKINSGSVFGMVGSMQQNQCNQYQIPEMHPQQQQSLLPVFMPGHPIQEPISNLTEQPIPNVENLMIDAAYCEMELITSPSTLMEASSDAQNPTQQRVPSSVTEKSVERRQKRLVKNRESAARSRARKLAYQNELEREVSRLEEENQRLKQMKEVELILPREPRLEPRYQLRRTSSAPI